MAGRPATSARDPDGRLADPRDLGRNALPGVLVVTMEPLITRLPAAATEAAIPDAQASKAATPKAPVEEKARTSSGMAGV